MWKTHSAQVRVTGALSNVPISAPQLAAEQLWSAAPAAPFLSKPFHIHREPSEQSWEQTEGAVLENLKQQFGLLSQSCTTCHKENKGSHAVFLRVAQFLCHPGKTGAHVISVISYN